MKNIVKRGITGIFLVAILVSAIVYSAWSFLVLFSIISFCTLAEYYKLLLGEKFRKSTLVVHALAGAYLFVAFFLTFSGQLAYNQLLKVGAPYLFYLIYTVVCTLRSNCDNPIEQYAYLMLGQCYVALPFALLNMIAFVPDSFPQLAYSPLLLLAFFVIIWVNDSGAYLVGVTFGKHRLWKRISPKKSWEGFVGGVVFALIAAIIFSYIDLRFSMIEWIGIGIVVSISSVFGDFSESLLKRTIGVKDSGYSIPGHGGFLDRFDSVLLASPALILYLLLIL